MREISNQWPKTAGRVQINGYYSSNDGLVQGLGKAGESFIENYERICKESAQKETKWIELLKSQGIKAAHPDDGWVDRKENYINFCYPQFKQNIEVGDLIALGDADKYRIVKVIKITKTMFGQIYYFFSHAKT